MWNAVIFFPLTSYKTWKSYVRELRRNRDLMEVCVFPGRVTMAVARINHDQRERTISIVAAA